MVTVARRNGSVTAGEGRGGVRPSSGAAMLESGTDIMKSGASAHSGLAAPEDAAPYNYLCAINISVSGGHYRRMNEPVIVCGRVFRPELVQHLSQMATQQPPPGRNVLAHEVCTHL